MTARPSSRKIELITAGICVVVLLIFLRKALFVGSATFAHDNLYWNYPIFRFFAHSLLNGEIPWWNPFSHGGEPFYPLWGQIRLYDPVTLGVLAVARFFTHDLLLLFHWVRFGQILFYLVGMYLFLRGECKSTFARLALMVILCFSSTFLGSFRQDGIINSFLWAPWAMLSFRSFLRDGGWKNAFAFAVCLGVNFQSYFFAGVWIWFLFLGTGLLLFRRDLLARFTAKEERKKVFVIAGLLFLFAMPNLAVVIDSRDFLLPARTAPSGFEKMPDNGGPFPTEPRPWDYEAPLRLPYSFVKATGGHSSPVDFLQLLSPEANPSIFGNPKWAWGEPSDAYLYLGVLPFFLILLGLIAGSGEWKATMLWTTAGMGFFLLGPLGGIHRLLFAIYPPVWFIRNTSCLVLFFQFGLLYFFVLGVNTFWSRTAEDMGKTKLSLLGGIAGAYLIALGIFSHEKLSWGIPLLVILGTFYFFRFRKTAFLGLLAADLLFRFYRADALYAAQTPLEEIYRVSSQNPIIRSLGKRDIAPSYPLGAFHQVPRYVELVELKPYAFSSAYLEPGLPRKRGANLFDNIWRNYRWNSLLLTRNYFKTVYDDKSWSYLSMAFRIGMPPLAFRRTIAGRDWPISYKILQPGYSHLKLAVDVPGNGWLYFSDGFHQYWNAKVDGESSNPVLADGAFKAVYLDGGIHHEVEFSYRPWPFMIGLTMYYAAFIFGSLGWALLAISSISREGLRRDKPDSNVPGGIIPPQPFPA